MALESVVLGLGEDSGVSTMFPTSAASVGVEGDEISTSNSGSVTTGVRVGTPLSGPHVSSRCDLQIRLLSRSLDQVAEQSLQQSN